MGLITQILAFFGSNAPILSFFFGRLLSVKNTKIWVMKYQ